MPKSQKKKKKKETRTAGTSARINICETSSITHYFITSSSFQNNYYFEAKLYYRIDYCRNKSNNAKNTSDNNRRRTLSPVVVFQTRNLQMLEFGNLCRRVRVAKSAFFYFSFWAGLSTRSWSALGGALVSVFKFTHF